LTQIADYTYSESLLSDIISTTNEYFHDGKDTERAEILRKTYEFARNAHEWQFRKSGEPYITHPLEAAKILLLLKPDIVSIQSCLLHDVIEDTPKTQKEIEELFGKDVAHICEWLSKLSAIKYQWEERTVESLRKMLIAMVDDLRVIIVKLADRLHNMQTLEHHPDPKKRERIALETLNIYAPIADRLGIFDFKEMLETECFKNLHKDEYLKIQEELKELKEEQVFFIKKAKSLIAEVISGDIPLIDISYRIKSPYSIYRKLSRKEYSYSHARDLYDLFAIRIITDSIPHCYEVLWILHNRFVPMPKRFKDYIALPKENGYQSLHTTVVWLFPEVRSQPTEIQIRTPNMHKQAEIGVAAHFEYSETGKSKASKDSYWVNTIKSIIGEWHAMGEFMTEMHMNVFSDQIFLFTPKGDIITLPKWSTPIDFAYAIHSNLGNKLAIAKVNGQVVPLDYELHNGESVQITIDQHKKPNPIWLSFVQTSKAKEHIRQFINREERSFFIEKWRFILNAYLEKNYQKWLDKELSILKNVDGKILDSKQKDDVLVQIGNLSRKPTSLLKSIHDDVIKQQLGERLTPIEVVNEPKAQKKESTNTEDISIIIGKERNIPYKMAKCCEAVPGISKIAWVIWQWIITIHDRTCINIEKVWLDRRIPARWSNEIEKWTTFEVECTVLDRRWILRDIANTVYSMGLNVVEISSEKPTANTTKIRLVLETSEDDYYIFERLDARFRFEVMEIQEIKLISMY